jgi:Tfp pilus assembly protein PilO
MNKQGLDESEWFDNDIAYEDLKELSEDEKKQDRQEQIKNTNKKKSQQNADNIQLQMREMSKAFQEMNYSLENNLKNVNTHIKEV